MSYRVKFNTSLDPAIIKKLRVYAAQKGRSMNDVLEDAINIVVDCDDMIEDVKEMRIKDGVTNKLGIYDLHYFCVINYNWCMKYYNVKEKFRKGEE